MAKKIDAVKVKETAEVRKSAIDYVLLSRVMVLWGLATAIQGVIIIYTMTAFLMANINTGAISITSTIALPYELNAVAGIFNLFFGVALVALGQKAKNW